MRKENAVGFVLLICSTALYAAFLILCVSLSLTTVWLPGSLVAIVVAFLSLARPSASRLLVVAGVASGVPLFWLMTERGVDLSSHPALYALSLCLLASALAPLSVLILRGTQSAKSAPSDQVAFRWGAILLCCSCVIAFFSSPRGGSGGMISDTILWFHLDPATAELVVKIVRKCIHFTFYGLLGFVSYRWALACGVERKRAVLIGLGMALAHASFDETRQTLYPDRTASAWDVVLDMTGASVFVGLSAVRSQLRKPLVK